MRRRFPLPRLIPAAALATLLLGVASAPAVAQTTFSDGDFAGWSFGAAGPVFAAARVEAAGGNPGARVAVETFTLFSVLGLALARNPSSQLAEALQGRTCSLSIDAISGVGAASPLAAPPEADQARVTARSACAPPGRGAT